MSRALRLLGVALHLAWGYGACVLVYPVLRPAGRGCLRRLWACAVLRALGIDLSAPALDVRRGSLVVANHVSWLDALALHALLPVSMVAKADTRDWPVLGTLLARNETIFVERRPSRRLLAVNAGIAARLARGECVALFPEGTTTGGGTVLGFRPALFEPAVRGGHPVHALALRYVDRRGERSWRAAYVEQMSLWQSLWAIAGHDGLSLEVRACGSMRPASRRDAAAAAQAAVYSSVCGSVRPASGPASAGSTGSGSPAGWTPSSAAPAWESSAEVSRT